MELLAELDAPCSGDELFAWVDDLDRYPEWLSIVRRAEPIDDGSDGGPAWNVDLRAQLGPLSRAKRLRMERTMLEPIASPRAAVFERRELDGRQHGRWTLRAEVHDLEPTDGDEGGKCRSRLVMTLHYDGRLWGPALAAVLNQEIEASRQRLLALVS